MWQRSTMMQRVLFTLVLLLVAAGASSACYSPTLPLPPPSRDGLSVEAPDADGYVLVAGDPGVMEYGDQSVITNLSTLYGWIVPVEEDASFQVRVEASGGDWLSVPRRAGYDSSPAIEIQVPSP